MGKEKELLTEGILINFTKKDKQWIQKEASYRRLAPTYLGRMAIIDWLRHNAETKEPK